MIRAIGQLYVASDLSRQMVGVNWDVTADVKLTEDLTRSKVLTEARNAELEAARAQIEYSSLHDFLTDLPNRMYLERALAEHAARCAQSGGGVALLQVDLDGFKQINDTLGHSAGDAMLIHTAETIRRHLRPGDFVARTGGDEFVVVCNADGGMVGLDGLAQRIIDDVSKPIDHCGHECRLGMSIGIAGAYGADVDRQRLLVDADLALYRAKSLGRNRFEFYTAALQAEAHAPKGPHTTRSSTYRSSKVSDEGLSHVKGLPRLKVLTLRSTAITDDALEHLKDLPQIQTLDLSQTKITDAGLKHLEGLPTQLQRLKLGWNGISDAGVEHLQKLLVLQESNLECPVWRLPAYL